MIAFVFNVVLVALPTIGMVVAYFVTGWWLDRNPKDRRTH